MFCWVLVFFGSWSVHLLGERGSYVYEQRRCLFLVIHNVLSGYDMAFNSSAGNDQLKELIDAKPCRRSRLLTLPCECFSFLTMRAVKKVHRDMQKPPIKAC